jgi:hypothetical protein
LVKIPAFFCLNIWSVLIHFFTLVHNQNRKEMKTTINKWQEISAYVNAGNISVRFDFYLKAWAMYAINTLKDVAPRMYFYNSGPLAYDKKIGFELGCALPNSGDPKHYCIWYRNDGCGIRVFEWKGSHQEWSEFIPDDRTPYAIDKEWGLDK